MRSWTGMVDRNCNNDDSSGPSILCSGELLRRAAATKPRIAAYTVYWSISAAAGF